MLHSSARTNPVTKLTSTPGARPTCLSSPSTSQVEGVSPSEPCAQRRPKSDVATAFAAAHDNIAPKRIRHTCSARFCKIAAPWLWPTVTQTISSRLTSGHPLPSRAPPALRGNVCPPIQVCAFFASPRRLQHHSVSIRSSTMWGPIAVETAHEGRVHSDDLQSTAVRQVRRCQVHVPNQHICCHASTSFAAHARCRTLQRVSPPSQNPRPST